MYLDSKTSKKVDLQICKWITYPSDKHMIKIKKNWSHATHMSTTQFEIASWVFTSLQITSHLWESIIQMTIWENNNHLFPQINYWVGNVGETCICSTIEQYIACNNKLITLLNLSCRANTDSSDSSTVFCSPSKILFLNCSMTPYYVSYTQ